MICGDRCTECAHVNVCRYKDEYAEAQAAVKEKMKAFKLNEAYVEVSLSCLYHMGRVKDTRSLRGGLEQEKPVYYDQTAPVYPEEEKLTGGPRDGGKRAFLANMCRDTPLTKE